MDTREAAAAYRLNKWTEIIRECHSSGQTVRAWCAAHDIKESAYFYWLNKVRKTACESLPALQSVNCNQIVEVKLAVDDEEKDSESHSDIILHIGEATLELHNGASESLIENTLRALQNVR